MLQDTLRRAFQWLLPTPHPLPLGLNSECQVVWFGVPMLLRPDAAWLPAEAHSLVLFFELAPLKFNKLQLVPAAMLRKE